MENNKEKGPFGGDDLDPIVFVNSGDTPELREAVNAIPRPSPENESAYTPKISRREILEESHKESEESSEEWVPNLETNNLAFALNKSVEYAGRLILALLPIALVAVFILYSAGIL